MLNTKIGNKPQATKLSGSAHLNFPLNRRLGLCSRNARANGGAPYSGTRSRPRLHLAHHSFATPTRSWWMGTWVGAGGRNRVARRIWLNPCSPGSRWGGRKGGVGKNFLPFLEHHRANFLQHLLVVKVLFEKLANHVFRVPVFWLPVF